MATTAADIVRAESMMASSWPALNLCLSGRWLLGMADGVSGRANSLFFLDPNDNRDFEARLDWMERTYRRAGLPPRVRVSPLTPTVVVRELKRRGYIFQKPTVTLRRSSENLPEVKAEDFEIVASPTCTKTWLDTFIACSPHYAEKRAVIEKMLHAVMDETTYFLGLRKGMPVTTAMGVQHLDCLTVQNVATRPEHKRQGLARATMSAAMAAAARAEARWCWLAVEQINTPAIALYRGLGFEDFYLYIYASLAA